MAPPVLLGDPIPAHRLLLRCGSEVFRECIERLEQPQTRPQARASDCFACDGLGGSSPHSPPAVPAPLPDNPAPVTGEPQDLPISGTDAATPITKPDSPTDDANPGLPDPTASRKRPRPEPTSSPTSSPTTSPTASPPITSPTTSPPCPSGRLPELRVPLGREDELPAARRALRFLYAGSVPHGVGFKDLLATRRLGAYLQIDGCAAACDAAMVRKLEEECPGCSAVVLDAYACWYAFPDDPSFGRVLAACARFLVAHFRDAPSVLNSRPEDPASLLRQFTSLPPPALEALLAAHDFATDSESSVLLLLAHWLLANPNRQAGVRTRLCGQIRALHLSPAYLRFVFPALPWFAADAEQCAALAALATTPGANERRILRASLRANGVNLGPGLAQEEGKEPVTLDPGACKWLAPARKSCVPSDTAAGATFTWSVSGEELARVARRAARVPLISTDRGRASEATLTPKAAGAAAAAANGGGGDDKVTSKRVVVHGLMWGVEVDFSRAKPPQVLLFCAAPDELALGRVSGVACRPTLTIQRAAGAGGADAAHRVLFKGPGGVAPMGMRLVQSLGHARRHGQRVAAAAAAGTDPDLVEALRGYVQPDGTVRGELRFEAVRRPFGGLAARAAVVRARGVEAASDDDDDDDDEEEEEEDED